MGSHSLHSSVAGPDITIYTLGERENDLRKNEIRSLEERQQKDNQARITDIAKLEGKLDSENAARKSEIAALDSWAKGENDARKTEIENLARTTNSIQATSNRQKR